jgi:hypothetical protein
MLFLGKKGSCKKNRNGRWKGSEVDHKVTEILGKDSMSVNRIGVDDTLESTEEEVFQLDTDTALREFSPDFVNIVHKCK